jgi:hypothetical protein
MTMPALAAPAVISRRCNPYGHETGGPRHLIGGVYGPEHEGPQKWVCENPAIIRARMICEAGHRGQVMDLCRAHAIEIQRRQAGLCPPCAWPPEARSWQDVIDTLQRELGLLHAAGLWHTPEAQWKRNAIESAGHRMTELFQNGTIRKNPLTLTEIS